MQPDLVVYSELTKSVTLMELTVCFETNFEEAKLRKEIKYADLVDEIDRGKWLQRRLVLVGL